MNLKKQIPNIFTLLNLLCGCLAIVFILQTNAYNFITTNEGTTNFSIPENIALGSVFIFIAAIIDFLDGFVARLLKAESALGAQLDSLSDVVSFGVAPSCILFQLAKIGYMSGANGISISYFPLMLVFIVAMAGAYRLARFNLDHSQSHGFKGLPIPSAGLLIASLPLIIHFNQFPSINTFITNPFFIYGFAFLVSFLMVSTIPLMALKFKDFSWNKNKLVYILIILSLISIIILKWASVPFIFFLYIIFSFIQNKQKS